MDKEETHFRQKFQEFPSSFNLKIKYLKGNNKIELYKKKLEEGIKSDEFESTTERIRIFDLLSFLTWSAVDREVAYTYNNKALELDKENIVSLSNRLWMRREDGYLTEANEELKKLDKLARSNNNLLLIGKAEMAFFYSVFGPSYLLKSKDILEDVVRNMRGNDIDTITLTLCTFDLGIIYRKLCNSGSMPRQGWEGRDEEECIKRGVELLYEVACSDSKARWRGRCWASLAELLNVISKGVKLDKYRKEELFPNEIKEKNIESLLDLAIKTCGEDSYVLKISGKLYKYLKKLDKAEEVLRKSLAKENTSYAHHHLALVLKQRLKDRLCEKKLPNNGSSNGYESGNKCIRHKTFLANDVTQEVNGNNVLSKSPTGECNDYAQELCKASMRTAVSTIERHISDTSEIEESVKPSTKEADCNLKNMNTRQITRASAKGFDRVFSIPEDEEKTVQEILYHLDEAIKFRNTWASLEKGIVLRQIKNFKEACEVFVMTLKLEEDISAVVEVSCYENLGACCRDIAEQETDSEQRRKREIDAVIYWRKALEKIASKQDKMLHFPKEEWMSYPVLKDMFEHRQPDIVMLKELAKLGEILERPAETRSFYREISELGEEEEANDPTIICGEIKLLLKEDLYESAVERLENSMKKGIKISNTFCKLVYLESAFYFASIGKREISRERFHQAFDAYICNSFDTEIEYSTAKSNFDIFILYDEDAEADKSIAVLSEKLEAFLSENFELRITSNSKSVHPGKHRWADQTQQMESSKYIVLLLDTNEKPDGYLEYFIRIIQEISKNNKSILNIILIDECTCPFELTVFPRMYFESERLKSNEVFIKWIRDFIFHLLCVSDNEE